MFSEKPQNLREISYVIHKFFILNLQAVSINAIFQQLQFYSHK